jgi:hypothetical protein
MTPTERHARIAAYGVLSILGFGYAFGYLEFRPTNVPRAVSSSWVLGFFAGAIGLTRFFSLLSRPRE